jgi:uncharacterized membrane protein YgcG
LVAVAAAATVSASCVALGNLAPGASDRTRRQPNGNEALGAVAATIPADAALMSAGTAVVLVIVTLHVSVAVTVAVVAVARVVALVVATAVAVTVVVTTVVAIAHAAVVARAATATAAAVVDVATSERRTGDQGGSGSRGDRRQSQDPAELAFHAYPP